MIEPIFTDVIVEQKRAAHPHGRMPFREMQLFGDPPGLVRNYERVDLGQIVEICERFRP